MGGTFRLRTVSFMAALVLSACASDRPDPRDTPPTPLTASADSEDFGVTHKELPNGWTEIFVKLNETSSRERARDMAWYTAARLAKQRGSQSLYISKDEAGIGCRVTGRKEPSAFGAGDPVSAVVALTFIAVYSIFAPAESWAGSPTHLLHVYFSDSAEPAHGIVPVPVNGIIDSLSAGFPPGAPDSPEDGAPSEPEQHAAAERENWAASAAANAAVCAERRQSKDGG